jgi:hypothetical protein
MKIPKRRKRPEPANPRWFIVRRGFVQYYSHALDGQRRVVLPLFGTREMACRFIDMWMDRMPRGDTSGNPAYRPAEIGTVDGETFATVLAGAADTGVDEIRWVQSVTPNGFDGPVFVTGEAGT